MSESRPRVAFFGTPDFAVPVLTALLDLLGYVDLVVTQPDRPAGRGQALQASPVKTYAQSRGLRTLTPLALGQDRDLQAYFVTTPDVAIVAAYGKMIPSSLLKKPRCGFLNVHPSLLPRWRGATPIQAAILAGDQTTGVSLMQLDVGLDTGPIIAQRSVPIHRDDTGQTLGDRLADAGGTLIQETLLPVLRGARMPAVQDEQNATLCKPLTRDDGLIDWREPAARIERMVRAFQPWPGAWTRWRNERVHLLASHVIKETGDPGRIAESPPLRIGCGRESLEITKLKFAGGKIISGADALRGRRLGGTAFALR